jgi:hypothetical protein
MRPIILLCCAVAVVGCAKTETKAADTQVAATPAPPPPPPAVTLGDVAGKWNVVAKNEAGDTTVITFDLTASPNTTGWSFKFPKMTKPVAVRVGAVAGDSIMIDAGPFPSQTRKGLTVSTNGVMHYRDGKLVGMTTAHYNVKTADSVRKLMMEGTRAP